MWTEPECDGHILDLAGVQPEAREVVRAAAEALVRHTAPWLIGLLVHGSAYKGGFIPGCSDVDLKLYLRDEAFAAADTRLPWPVASRIQSDLARIDPAPFQHIQRYAERRQPTRGRVGPIPGAYRLLTGSLPVPDATEAELRASARAALDRLDPYPPYISSDLLHSGGGRLERLTRFVCADIWPALYHTLAIERASAIAVWRAPKLEAMALLPADSARRDAIEGFYLAALAYYGASERSGTVAGALALVEQATRFLTATHEWWDDARKRVE